MLQTCSSFLPKSRWKGSAAGASASFPSAAPDLRAAVLGSACCPGWRTPFEPPPVLNQAALGFRWEGKVALGTGEARVTRHSLYLYFKQALTRCRPRAWQVLFLRRSDAGRETVTAFPGKVRSRECTECNEVWASSSLKVGKPTKETTASLRLQ